MAAQVLYTLQPTGIQGVTFTVNQQPYAIPGADPGTFEVILDSRFAAFDPIPAGHRRLALHRRATTRCR